MAGDPSPDWKTYLVGGAVRDDLLGLPIDERDWIVVGATPAQMEQAGFVAVDAEFPVFRHPQTGEEYALARRETKRGEGYRGFVVDAGPGIALEEDLRRRDLTINAMARSRDGSLIDPFGGRDDLDVGVLRHVSPAFVEDPLRVLRIARFAAKLGEFGFRVAHATHHLMCDMVQRGDMQYLAAERTWRETLKAAQTAQPWRFFEVLQRCGALQHLLPALAAAMGEGWAHEEVADSAPVAALKRVCRWRSDPPARLAAAFLPCLDDHDGADAMLAGSRADRETARLLRRALDTREVAARARALDSDALLNLLTRWRGLAAGADLSAPAAVFDAQYAEPVLRDVLPVAAVAARAVTADALRDRGLSGAALGEGLAAARCEAIERALRAASLVT